MTEFQSALFDWYDGHKRELPWRKSEHSDPYAVWVSEAMLQQTTVATVVPYFERWIERFPNVFALAAASEADVLSLWSGLGYYSRARNLHAAAAAVVEDGWPTSVAGWRRLPGVGPYTAGAVASIAQGAAAALVDGNVERVYARLRANGAIGGALKADALEWAEVNLEAGRPGDWNQALMELGATVCTPKTPRCLQCPVARFCEANRKASVGDYPSPKPRKQWVDLSHVTVVPVFGTAIGLVQAKSGDWWSGLWYPPRAEDIEEIAEVYGLGSGRVVGRFRHVVTKHRIELSVRRVDLVEAVIGLTFVELGEIWDWPLSAPGRKSITLAVSRDSVIPGLE